MSDKVDLRIIEMIEEFLVKYSEYRGAIRKVDGYRSSYRHFNYGNELIIVETGINEYGDEDGVNDNYYSYYEAQINVTNPNFDIDHWIKVESFRPARNPDMDKYDSDCIKKYYNLVISLDKLKEEVTGLKTALKMVEKYSSHLTMKWRGGYLTSINSTPIREWIAEMLLLQCDV